jgi:hypothetical protein
MGGSDKRALEAKGYQLAVAINLLNRSVVARLDDATVVTLLGEPQAIG